jgi:ubiquinone/menaquinone biosynthesis C-methylase UbiE
MTSGPTVVVDSAKAQEFAGRMLARFNDAALTLMVSVGHRTGLFDTMAQMVQGTSEQVALAAKLKERYVREWLGAMVLGRIVTYDPHTRTYRLPPEHAASLTRAAGANNVAMFAQYISLVGNVEDQVVECFRKGGGVPYSAFPKFQQLQAEESAMTHDAILIDVILPMAPGLVERLKSGLDVADVGCGSGHILNVMAKAFPQSRFVGFDISRPAIAEGRDEAKKLRLKNVRFAAADVSALKLKSACDLVLAIDTIHDQAKPRRVLKAIATALRPGGVFLMEDIAASSRLEENMDHPLGPALFSMSTMHCLTVSLAYKGEGLGNMWGEQKARELLSEAGFADVATHDIPGDPLHRFYVATRK